MLEFFSPQNLNALWTRLTSGHAFMATGIVLLMLLLLRTVILRIAYRNIEDKFVRLRYKRTLSYIIVVIALFLLLPIWLPSIRNIATFLGIFGAGFLIVTRDLWVCVGGWAYIMIRRPYVIGDRIQIGNISGDVIDIRLMETSIMEVSGTEGGLTTGRIIYFPNAKVFSEIIATTRLNAGHTYQELHVQIDPASDWEAAAALLEKITRTEYATSLAAREQLASEDEETDLLSGYREPRVLAELKGALVILHLQFMAPAGQAANLTDRIWRQFLIGVRQNPTIRFAPEKPDKPA